jgi:hypothetical protein
MTTRREYTAQEAEQFTKAEEQLRRNGLDSWTQKGIQANADLIDQFFQANPTVPVTVANIYKAVEKRKSEFAWLTPPQTEWYLTAQKNPELANQLAGYLASTSGRPGALAKDGDDLFVNLLLMFTELHARRETVSSQTIASAENRIANRAGKQLARVPAPRRTEPISPAAKADDGSPFLGGDMAKNADGSYRSKTYAEQKAEREAAERAKSTPAPAQREPDAWESLCDQLKNYGTHHSQRAAMQETFDRGVANGKSFREIYAELTSLKKQYEFSPAPLAPSIKARSIQ